MQKFHQFWKSEEGEKFITECVVEEDKMTNQKLKKLNQKAAKIGARVVMMAEEEILLEEQECLPGNGEIVLQEQANAAVGEEEERASTLQDNQKEEERG